MAEGTSRATVGGPTPRAEHAALVKRLRAEGRDGPTASLLRRQLWTYGFHELRRHLQTGTINQVNTGVPHPLLLDDDAELLRESADERDGLVVDTLARTVDPFVARLLDGAWRSNRGASLDTYYLGALGRAFWDVYDSWKRSRRRAHREMIAADAHRRTSAPNDHPSERIASIEALQVVVAEANPEQRVILARIVQGYSHREIADEIGTTPEGIGSRLYRLRQRAWTAVEHGRIDRSVVPSPRR